MECRNLIRELIAELLIKYPAPTLDLSVGDPTKFGGIFGAPDMLRNAMVEVVTKERVDGYAISIGDESCRRAVAKRYGVEWQKLQITAGCSSSIDLTFRAYVGEDDIVLVPVPGFPLYETLLKLNQVPYARYTLNPHDDWKVDVESMINAVRNEDKHKVKMVLVCNPSNPTGSVYPREHLHEVMTTVKTHFPNAVVLADQVYEDVVFEGEFVDMGPMGIQMGLPTICVSSLAKGFHAPGWRMGWIISHDANGELDTFRKKIQQLSNTTMGAASIIQHAFKKVITEHMDEVREFRAKASEALQLAVKVFADGLESIEGVEVSRPKGAMFIMFKLPFPEWSSLDACIEMLQTERLLLLPGDACFGAPKGFVRALVAVPPHVAEDAVRRIARFCEKQRASRMQSS